MTKRATRSTIRRAARRPAPARPVLDLPPIETANVMVRRTISVVASPSLWATLHVDDLSPDERGLVTLAIEGSALRYCDATTASPSHQNSVQLGIADAATLRAIAALCLALADNGAATGFLT